MYSFLLSTMKSEIDLDVLEYYCKIFLEEKWLTLSMQST